MKARRSSLLAIGVVVISLTFGILALLIGRIDPGITLEQDGVYVRIASVAHYSPAQLDGFVAGRRNPREPPVATALEPASGPIRLAIVEDHPVVREGTAALLAAQPGISVEGTAGSLAEARELLQHTAIDVVLLDIRLGGESGLGLLAGGSQVDLPAAVVLTAFDYPQYADAARRMGAAGFVLKTAPLTDLVAAIRLAASGERGIQNQQAASPADYPTVRELEVVRLLVEGRSNDEIGVALKIGSRTV